MPYGSCIPAGKARLALVEGFEHTKLALFCHMTVIRCLKSG